MITLVGVGHVFQLRQTVRAIIEHRRPDIVCVELDKVRYEALLDRRRGAAPSLMYKLLADFQERLAESYGSSVGDEMLAAVDAARELGAQVYLIDMDSDTVFRRLWGELTLRERVLMGITALGAMFVTKKRVERELRRFEEHQEEYMAELEERFPSVKRILIDERDSHMARQLGGLSASFRHQVAIVGDGHITGISRQLTASGIEHEVLRLSQLRSPSFVEGLDVRPGADDGNVPDGAEVSFSFYVEQP